MILVEAKVNSLEGINLIGSKGLTFSMKAAYSAGLKS